jgi:hypothetical protein
MAIDLRGLKTEIYIGGYDLSLQLDSVIISDDYLDDRGIVAYSASLDLVPIIGGRSLNDFFGIDWLKIGTQVKVRIKIDGTFYPHPRGTLYIVGTKYNPKLGSNQIDLACLLGSRKNNEELDELLIPVNIGTAKAAIDLLFNLAGCGAAIWHTSANFNLYDRPALSNSYLVSAGELLAAMGCYCYMDGNNAINIREVETHTPILTIPEAALVTFEGVLVGSPVNQIASGSGSYREISNRPSISSVSFPNYGEVSAIVPGGYGTGVISRTTVTDTIDFNSYVVSSREINERIGFQVYKGRSGFPRTNPVRESVKIITKYYNALSADHELLSEYELNSSVAATALQSYGEWADNNKKPFSASSDISGKRTVIYRYSSNLELLSVVESIWTAIGETLASLSSVDWEVIYNAFGLPDEQFLSARNIEIWSKDSGDWKRVTSQEYTNLKIANGQAGINEKITKAQPSELIGIYRDAVSCSASSTKSESSTSGQVTPPDIERFPSRIITVNKQAEATVKFSGFNGSLSKVTPYVAPYLPDVRKGESVDSFLYKYVAVWHKAALIRWQSIQIEIPFSLALLNAYPYCQIDVVGPTATYRLAMNGSSWAIDNSQALISSDCSLIGVVQPGGVISRYAGNNLLKFGLFFNLKITSPDSYSPGSKIKMAIAFNVTSKNNNLILNKLIFNKIAGKSPPSA